MEILKLEQLVEGEYYAWTSTPTGFEKEGLGHVIKYNGSSVQNVPWIHLETRQYNSTGCIGGSSSSYIKATPLEIATYDTSIAAGRYTEPPANPVIEYYPLY